LGYINAFAQRANDPEIAVPVTEAEVTFVAICDDHHPMAIFPDSGRSGHHYPTGTVESV